MKLSELYTVHKTAGDRLALMLSGSGIPVQANILEVTALIYDSLQEPTSGDKAAVKTLRGAMAQALEYLVVGILHEGVMNRMVWRRALDSLAEVS